MDNCLHVAYATDDNYVMYVGISMYSLFNNNRTFSGITVHILCNNVSAEKKQQLCDIAREFDRNILFYDCSDISKWLGESVMVMFRNEKTNVPITSYVRLFLPNIIDGSISKMLYLDADSIISGNYNELWNDVNSDKYTVMGVIDNVSEEAKVKVGLDADYAYINAGVLLMNLSLMRKNNSVKSFTEFIERYNGRVFHHDQGVINGVLSKSIGYISPKYNMMSFMYETKRASDIAKRYGIKKYYSEQEIKEAFESPVFLHFTEGNLQRPWVCGCKHPLRGKWIYYKNKTIWKNVPMCADNRGAKLKLLSWMRLNMPDWVTKAVLRLMGR